MVRCGEVGGGEGDGGDDEGGDDGDDDGEKVWWILYALPASAAVEEMVARLAAVAR